MRSLAPLFLAAPLAFSVAVAAETCPYQIVYAPPDTETWTHGTVKNADRISKVLERHLLQTLTERGFVIVPHDEQALGIRVKARGFSGSGQVVLSMEITSAALANRWRLIRDTETPPMTHYSGVGVWPSLAMAKKMIRDDTIRMGGLLWRLTEGACRALESGHERELIAVEALRRELVSEIVAGRERLRQERRVEVEIEDR